MALYLVTGGAGFIGSHLATALVERGDRVRVLDDLSTGRAENLAHLGAGEPGCGAAVELVRGDVVDPYACRAACEGVHGVFHEAAQVSVQRSLEEPERSFEVNVMGTLRLLEAARRAGVARVVFAGSSAAYGDAEGLPKVEDMPPRPLSPYAAGKVAGEHLMRVWGRIHGLRTVTLRYFNVFGPRQADDNPYSGVIALFARALLEGRRPTIFGDGRQTRDFAFVDNVVDANLAAMGAELAPGEVLNVGGGDRVSLLELVAAIGSILGCELEPLFADARAGDVRHSVASIEKARRLLGWAPRTDWRRGLTKTLEWYAARFADGS